MRNGKISNPEQVCYVRRYTLNGGNEDGIRVVELYNGTLRVLLNESRALDIMQLFHKGMNVSFLSKNGFVSREQPFLNRFEGGMLYTCGLDSFGGREGFELHGTHHIAPAKILRADVTDGVITVVGEVRQSALFGQDLRFVRTVTLKQDADTVKIEDEIINEGFLPAKYCVLYHTNLGYPMIDEGARVITHQKDVVPRNDWAKAGLNDRTTVTDSVVGLEERCFFLEDCEPHVELVNEKIGKKFVLEYSKDTLPAFIQWNSFASGDYALGLEPASAFLDDGFAYRTLAAAQTVRFALSIGVKEI